MRQFFAVEENIAQAVNFDFNEHKLAHQYLLNEFQQIKDKLISNNGTWPNYGNAHCLMDCLIRHINEDSRPLKIVLDTCSYDFNP